MYFMELKISETQLEKAAHQILDDPECGDVFRIKGLCEIRRKCCRGNRKRKNEFGLRSESIH